MKLLTQKCYPSAWDTVAHTELPVTLGRRKEDTAGDPGLEVELGTRWKAPGQPYLWAPALNLFWRHKEVGHQEEHILSLEGKRKGLCLRGSLSARGQKLAAWFVREGTLASSSHQRCAPGKCLQEAS